MNEKIIGLFAGKPKHLHHMTSAIRKDSYEQLQVHTNSIQGDDPFNKKHHGGPKRVIHHYSMKNYQLLKEKFPEIADKFIPGSYGENLCTEHLSEEDFCIGDIVQIGSVKAQVTIPRSPCATIDVTYEQKGILKEIIQNCHYGWFYQVLTPGEIKMTDHLKLIERPFRELNLYHLIQMCSKKMDKNLEFLKQAKASNILDDSWNKKVTNLL